MKKTMIIKTYREMLQYSTFEERLAYLMLKGNVGEATFGFDRWINQNFYSSYEWKHVRDLVIVRDNGCDLGVDGYEIHGSLLIHHINPMSKDDVVSGEEWICNSEYLITTTKQTHNAIHYGNTSLAPKIVTSRSPGDTKLW